MAIEGCGWWSGLGQAYGCVLPTMEPEAREISVQDWKRKGIFDVLANLHTLLVWPGIIGLELIALGQRLDHGQRHGPRHTDVLNQSFEYNMIDRHTFYYLHWQTTHLNQV